MGLVSVWYWNRPGIATKLITIVVKLLPLLSLPLCIAATWFLMLVASVASRQAHVTMHTQHGQRTSSSMVSPELLHVVTLYQQTQLVLTFVLGWVRTSKGSLMLLATGANILAIGG